MTDSPPRLRVRRHTDGRVAVQVVPGSWWTITRGGPGNCVIRDEPPDDGWVELFVAELPEPDGSLAGDDKLIHFWDITTGRLLVEDGTVEDMNYSRDPDELRAEALKMLAAVNQSDRLQEESNS